MSGDIQSKTVAKHDVESVMVVEAVVPIHRAKKCDSQTDLGGLARAILVPLARANPDNRPTHWPFSCTLWQHQPTCCH